MCAYLLCAYVRACVVWMYGCVLSAMNALNTVLYEIKIINFTIIICDVRVHAYVSAHVRACVYVCVYVCMCVCVRLCVRACVCSPNCLCSGARDCTCNKTITSH